MSERTDSGFETSLVLMHVGLLTCHKKSQGVLYPEQITHELPWDWIRSMPCHDKPGTNHLSTAPQMPNYFPCNFTQMH